MSRGSNPLWRLLLSRVTQRLVVLTPFSAWLAGGAFAENASQKPENAALHYWVAFTLCPAETPTISATTSDDPKLGFSVPVSDELAKTFRGQGHRALEHLYRGAKLETCGWGTDLRKYGPGDEIVHGEKAHALARLALLRAR